MWRVDFQTSFLHVALPEFLKNVFVSEFWSQHRGAELACQRIFLEFMTYHTRKVQKEEERHELKDSTRSQIWCIVLLWTAKMIPAKPKESVTVDFLKIACCIRSSLRKFLEKIPRSCSPVLCISPAFKKMALGLLNPDFL